MFPDLSNRTPLFIGGYARSGTTLFLKLLDGHPEIFALGGETHFFAFLNRRKQAKSQSERQKFLTHRRVSTKNNQEIWVGRDDHTRSTWQPRAFWADLKLEETGLQQAEQCLLEALQSDDERHVFESLVSVCMAFTPSANTDASHYVEKSPGNEFYWPTISRLFPTARLLHMLRDPFDVLASRAHRSKKLGSHWYLDDIGRWKRSVRAFRQARKLTPDRVIGVDFSALLSNPEQQLTEICDFVGVPFQASLLVPTSKQGGQKWQSHSRRADLLDHGHLDPRLAHSDAREVLSNELMRLCAAVIGDDYERLGFSKYQSVFHGASVWTEIPRQLLSARFDVVRVLLSQTYHSMTNGRH